MKTDDFESRLERQAPRKIPADWRAEILAAAHITPEAQPPTGHCSLLVSRIRACLWPHPRAWAGLAAVWLVILAMNFAARDDQPQLAVRNDAPPPPDVIMVLNRQSHWEAELIGPDDLPVAEPPKSVVPRPRSEWRVETRNV